MRRIWQTFLAAYRPENALDFKGEASQGDFWYFVLGLVCVHACVLIALFIAGLLDIALPAGAARPLIAGCTVVLAVSIVPTLSVTCRRYRDAGFRGWVCPGVLFIIAVTASGAVAALMTGMTYSPARTGMASEFLEAAFAICSLVALGLTLLHVFFLACPTDSFRQRYEDQL